MMCLTLVLGALAGADEPPLPATGFIEKFEVPERDKEGNLKWKLSGERAQIEVTQRGASSSS